MVFIGFCLETLVGCSLVLSPIISRAKTHPSSSMLSLVDSGPFMIKHDQPMRFTIMSQHISTRNLQHEVNHEIKQEITIKEPLDH